MAGTPLAIALLLVNVGFLAFAGFVLGEVAENAQIRNKTQMDLIVQLVTDIRDCRQGPKPTSFHPLSAELPMKMTEQGRKSADGARRLQAQGLQGQRRRLDDRRRPHLSGAGPPQVKQGMTITQAQGETIFADDMAEFEEGVTMLLDGKPIEPHQFDAYVSLAFNIGLGAFAGSTTLRHFLTGAPDKAAEAILMWNRPAEIKARRRGEHQQFLNLQHIARA